MYRVGVKSRFNAAHKLEGHPGKCSRLHGHTWYVEAVFATSELGDEAMVIDFGDARAMLESVTGPFDHSYLNEIEPFSDDRPTAENVARVIFEGLLEEMEREGYPVTLEKVTVWESPDTWAECSSQQA
jgi:6-pyruvoyltetrahydropterin/6-carboxytetrahydropterin synthase